MAFAYRTLLVEPESQSGLFLLVNLIVFIHVVRHVVSWPYTLIYALVHFIIFLVINRRLAAGRVYVPKKNLSKQTVVVTGAAGGIGRETALQLAKLQARVIVGIRDRARAERIARELSEQSHGTVIGYHLDLSDLASVKAFAEKIDQVDILINNAGVAREKQDWTKDGLESTFGTNHIGHFYLTQLLLPLLVKSNGRIVNVSSVMHVFTSENIDFAKNKPYAAITAYSDSKLANILHVTELQRRYGNRGIKAYALHPGAIASTEIGRERSALYAALVSPIAIISKTIPQGAMTTLFCALSDEAQPGKYHSDCRVVQPSPLAYNVKKAEELWELSEKIINDKTKHL